MFTQMNHEQVKNQEQRHGRSTQEITKHITHVLLNRKSMKTWQIKYKIRFLDTCSSQSKIEIEQSSWLRTSKL